MMASEQLTYAGIAERLGISTEAARAIAKRQRLVRSRGNDGKTLVSIDFAEIRHRPLPARTPPAAQAAIPPVSEQLPLASPFLDMLEALNARITALEAELAASQAELAAEQQRSAGHRADFERERDRGDRLDTALDRMIAELQAVRALLEAAQTVTTEPVHTTAAAGDRPGNRAGVTSWRWPLALVELVVGLVRLSHSRAPSG
jgi:hypothetical protein